MTLLSNKGQIESNEKSRDIFKHLEKACLRNLAENLTMYQMELFALFRMDDPAVSKTLRIRKLNS